MHLINPFLRLGTMKPRRSRAGRWRSEKEIAEREAARRRPITLPRVRFLEKPFDPTEVWVRRD